LLVSVSIIGILSLLIVQVFFTSLRTNSKTELMKDLKQNGDYAIQIMVRMIQNAETVSSCNSNALTLRSTDGWDTTFSSYGDGDVCRIASYSASPVPDGTLYTLTSSNVSMNAAIPADCTTALSFSCEEIQSQVSKVDISFDLVQKGSPPDAIDNAKQNFSSSVVVRNR
jgi:type II secretory pathway pseudopilin PulG